MNIRERARSRKRNKSITCRAAAAIAVMAAAFVLLASCPSKPVQWQAYTISGGDTLWAIARREYGDSADIRRKIAEICAENDINADRLQVGDVILIPIEAHK